MSQLYDTDMGVTCPSCGAAITTANAGGYRTYCERCVDSGAYKMNRLEWFGLYGESWGDDLVPEAYSHPAKYSRGLIRQIYRHMLVSGMIALGDTIGDPFGGQAGGALDAMRNGLHWVGVELEPRFVELGNQNIGLWMGKYAPHFDGWGTAVLVQGDSRNFAGIVGGLSGAISSPPYVDAVKDSRIGGGIDLNKSKYERSKLGQNGQSKVANAYGQTPGQLGSMKPGDLSAAISSPPYADTIENGDGPGARWDAEGHPGNPDKVSSDASYGRSPGQVGRLDGVISSPPFIDERARNGRENQEKYVDMAVNGRIVAGRFNEYGKTPGQLGVMSWSNLATSQDSGIIKDKENDKWQKNGNALIVEKKFQEEASDVDHAQINTLANYLQEDQSQQDTGQTLARQDITNQCLSVGGNRILTGQAEPILGGGMHGELKGGKQSKETKANVRNAAHPKDCKSIISCRKKKRVASGIMKSRISKRYALGVTYRFTGKSFTRSRALRAGLYSNQKTAVRNIVQANVESKMREEPISDTGKNAENNNFWSAAKEIVAQTYAALKPGGYAAWVCGDFVRKGKRVNFGQQWLDLCVSVGFEAHTWAIAWKTEHNGTQTSLFGDVEKRTDRVSFFRRLANEKNPDAAILNEDVIIVRKPI